jgi:DNA helicase II / ATP-dependent DNA helicase PcrA
MNLVRHERGLSKTESRFPAKGTCVSIYSRCVNAQAELEQVLGAHYPWCSGWATELKELFAAYGEAKQKHNVLDYDDLLLYWAQRCAFRSDWKTLPFDARAQALLLRPP